MADERQDNTERGWETFRRTVGAKEQRRLQARRTRIRNIWFGLGMFGVVGWSVALPTVLLTALGVWLDGRYGGSVSWTLTLLGVGIVFGCWSAWYWVSAERRTIEDERHLPGPETTRPRSTRVVTNRR